MLLCISLNIILNRTAIMEVFNSSQLLPQNLVIVSAETYLYRIGLSLTTKSYVKRPKLNHPLLVFIVTVISIIKIAISLFFSENNKYYFIIVGDFGYFFGVRFHFNISAILYMLLALSSQLIYYYNYKNDIKPNFLKIFEMISGFVSPKSIGLSNEKEILHLLKVSKFLFIITKFISQNVIPIAAFMINIIPILLQCSTSETLIFGLPNSLLFSLCCYYVFSINVWQVLYFYIICLYFKIKLKDIYNKVFATLRNGRYIIQIIRSLNSIYLEIHENNSIYWSKYFLTIWFLYVSMIITNMSGVLFSETTIILKLMISYTLLQFIIIFIIVINTASSVNFEANKIYLLLNRLMVYQNKSKSKSFKNSLISYMKVNIFFYSNVFILKILNNFFCIKS